MHITREQFDAAMEAVWSEIKYQNTLPRRTEREETDDRTAEAHDVPGFLTLARRYARKIEDDWADQPAPVEDALHGLRKVAAIFTRAMIYSGIRSR